MFRVMFILVGWLNICVSPFVVAEEQAEISLVVPKDPNGNTETISSLAFSNDGKRLAVGYGHASGLLQEPIPGQSIVWDVKSGKRLTVLQGYRDGVSSVDFSEDGKLLATGSFDGTIQLWSVPRWRRVGSIEASQGAVTSLDFCRKSSDLVVGTWQDQEGNVNNAIYLYQAATGRKVARFDGHIEGVMSVHFSPDCKLFVSSAMDGTVRRWDAERGTSRVLYQADNAWFHSVAFSSDGHFMAACGGELRPGTWHLRLWDARKWKLNKELSGSGEPLRSLVFSPDRKWLAAATTDGKGMFWNLTDEDPIALTLPAERIAFSPDGKVIAVAHKRAVRLMRVQRLTKKQ